MRRFLSAYLVTVGVAVNLVLLSLSALWLSERITEAAVLQDLRRLLYGPLDGVPVRPVAAVAAGALNPALQALPPGTWWKVFQDDGATAGFRRQEHGGAAFDTRRGRVMLFGSDTHGRNWDNTVRFFDMGALAWSSAYPPDDPATYRVNADGVPVAGVDGDHPWAMHSFGAVEYDPAGDRLIVASHPKHMNPGKHWGVDRALWRQIRRHPTWVYHLVEGRWEALPGKAVSFFPYATTYDPIRNSVIGVKSAGYYELTGDPPRWRRIAKGTPQGWHVAAAYDPVHETVVAYGTHKRSDSVWQYRRGDPAGRRMPTPGPRPPGGESVPLVYHPEIQRVVALVERRAKGTPGTTETWLYATATDSWQRVESATLPFRIGMNYHMVYDPGHDLLVLVANMRKEPLAVWVLRLAP